MASFGTTHYIKNENFSKEDFFKAISEINSAKSVTGIAYANIKYENEVISGIRESTSEPFSIIGDNLYKAYLDLNEFTTTSLKPYVNRVQSPSLAILIAVGAIKEEAFTPEEIAKRKKRVKSETENKKRLSDLKKALLTFIIGGAICCGIALMSDSDERIKNGQLTQAAHEAAVVCIKSKIPNPGSFEDGSWKGIIWDSQSTTNRYLMMNFFTYKNNYGERVRGEAYVMFDIKGKPTYVQFHKPE